MNKNEKRDYNCSDVNMMVASQIIAQNFKTNIDELADKRKNWNAAFADDLNTRINDTMSSKLGLNPKAPLTKATVAVNQIMKPASQALSSFRVQLGVDIADKAELKRIFTDLGFDKNYAKAQSKDQEAMIELLYAFQNGMTTELKDKVTQNIPDELIDEIMGYAGVLKDANVTQEGLKLSTPLVTKETITILNSIYKEIIGICKVASNIYKSNKDKKSMFSFQKTIENLQPSKKVIKPAA